MKELISICKVLNNEYKKSRVEMFKYCIIKENTFYHISDNGAITVDNVDLPNGIYSLKNMAIGKYLQSKDFDFMEYYEKYKSILLNNSFGKYSNVEHYTTSNDFKSFLKYTSSEPGVLSGIGINETGKVATNCHILKDSTTTSENLKVIKLSICNLIAAINETEVEIYNCNSENTCHIVTSRVSIYTQFDNSNYPNYKAVIPKNNKDRLTFDRLELINLLDKLSKFKYKSIEFSNYSIRAIIPELELVNVKSSIMWIYEHLECETFTVVFNIKYLTLICKDLTCKNIEIYIRNRNFPVVIENTVLMPIRLNDTIDLVEQTLIVK